MRKQLFLLVVMTFGFSCVSTVLGYSGGNGSEEAPYVISTAADLVELMDSETSLNDNFVLGANIDMTGIAAIPIGTDDEEFGGVFDGDGYQIANLSINRSGEEYVGLFGVTWNAEIRNVSLIDVSITGGNYCGGLAGKLDYRTTVSNCSVSGTINSNGNQVGGITGESWNCTLENCVTHCTVYGVESVGGLIGNCNYLSEVRYCDAGGHLITTGDSTGGLIGETWNNPIDQCSFNGIIESEGQYTGGLIGYNNYNSVVSDCYSQVSIYAKGEFAGGMVGENWSSELIRCGSICTIESLENKVGGLIGVNQYDSHVSECYAVANLIGDGSVGGLMGESRSAEIDNCYASGNVYSSGHYCGGLIGSSWTNSTENCYSTTHVEGEGLFVAGFVGYVYDSIFGDCFWDVKTSGTADGVGYADVEPESVVGLTSEAMFVKANYVDAGWNFDGDSVVWRINDLFGYPQLVWQEALTGDIAGGYGVNLEDFGAFATLWQSDSDVADFNESGLVDLTDLLVLAENWLGM